MRDGCNIGESFEFKSTNLNQLIEKMVGRELKDKYPIYKRNLGDVLFEVEAIHNKKVDVGQFNVRKGEIVGISGLMGAGRTELARAIFGTDSTDKRIMKMHGKTIMVRNPEEAISNGIGYLTEDRKAEGLALRLDCEKNINMAAISQIAKMGIVNKKTAVSNAEHYIDALKIKTPASSQLAEYLSGGNQQKLIIAKWLCRKVALVIFDEPTRGIDVGSKYEIYKLMNQLSDEGIGIIMISSDLPEILGMSDRIMFMYEGKLVGEVETKDTNQEQVLQYILGVNT
ncbi:MAG: ATP-binding cassette domain-containing protein [Ruminiclostridium sp.]